MPMIDFQAIKKATQEAIDNGMNCIYPDAQTPSHGLLRQGLDEKERALKKKTKLEAQQLAVNYQLRQFKAGVPDADGAINFKCVSWSVLRNISFTHLPPALLSTTSSDTAAAAGMVAKAIEQGWSPISVSGTDEFMSNVFHQAVRMGVEVSDYTPTERDLARLQEERLPTPAWVNGNEISRSVQVDQKAPVAKTETVLGSKGARRASPQPGM